MIFTVCKSIKNEITQTIKDTGFLEFMNQQEKIDMFSVADSELKDVKYAESEFVAQTPKKDEFYINVNLSANLLCQTIATTSAWTDFSFDYDIHMLTIKHNENDLLILKIDPKSEYFGNFFKQEPPFMCVFQKEKFLISKRHVIHSEFKLNEKEISLMKKYIVIKREKSPLLLMYMFKKLLTTDVHLNFFESDGQLMKPEKIYYMLKIKLAQEVYKIMY